MSGGRPPEWKRGNSAREDWGLGGDNWDLGRTVDWTETMGDLEGGTGGWSGMKRNLGKRQGDWTEIMWDSEERTGD